MTSRRQRIADMCHESSKGFGGVVEKGQGELKGGD